MSEKNHPFDVAQDRFQSTIDNHQSTIRWVFLSVGIVCDFETVKDSGLKNPSVEAFLQKNDCNISHDIDDILEKRFPLPLTKMVEGRIFS